MYSQKEDIQIQYLHNYLFLDILFIISDINIHYPLNFHFNRQLNYCTYAQSVMFSMDVIYKPHNVILIHS